VTPGIAIQKGTSIAGKVHKHRSSQCTGTAESVLLLISFAIPGAKHQEHKTCFQMMCVKTPLWQNEGLMQWQQQRHQQD